MAPRTLGLLGEALAGGHLSSGGPFAKRCEDWLRGHTGAASAILVQSCTAGLEVAMGLAGIGPGDEVIMPSFNFPSAANAVAMRGGVPVFVDIRMDTLNLDEQRVEAALGPSTKAILCVDYGGVPAEFDALLSISERHGLILVEDAAHAFQSCYRGRAAGGLAPLSVFSFHDTKDVTCGEGGALIVNRSDLAARADAIAEKGTNRKEFLAGHGDHYTWVDIGHSAKPSEITASVLWAQLEDAASIRSARREAWRAYHAALEPLDAAGMLRRPFVPPHCEINGHSYFVILPVTASRPAVIRTLAQAGIEAFFHFVPLHSAPAGRRHGRAVGDLPVTAAVAERILRLPLWPGIAPYCAEIAAALGEALVSAA